MMEQLNTKYIIEVRKNYTIDKDGQFLGGEWEQIKDEFGFDFIFDYYSEAYRILKAKCPAIEMFGHHVGRVKEVEMVRKLK